MVQLSAENDDAGVDAEVELTLRGRPTDQPTRGQLNLLWLISHPEEAPTTELECYDLAMVASRRYAAELAPALQVPVEPLLQFTDPRLFYPDSGGAPVHDVLFVGNWRGEFRRIVWDAIQTGHSPALYGQKWDLLAPEHAVAEYVPHAELRHLYSTCRTLFCDHWEDMRRQGFAFNRVFDALACGALVIADDNPALGEELPGAVETYATAPSWARRSTTCNALTGASRSPPAAAGSSSQSTRSTNGQSNCWHSLRPPPPETAESPRPWCQSNIAKHVVRGRGRG